MTRWPKGEATIEDMIRDGQIEQVAASLPHATALLDAAAKALKSVEVIVDDDPESAYALMYDAARKAMTAILAVQGLRATSTGGHVAVYEAVYAQLEPPLGHLLRPFNRMRRRRNEVEYPSLTTPAVTSEEVSEDLGKAAQVIEVARKALPNLGAF